MNTVNSNDIKVEFRYPDHEWEIVDPRGEGGGAGFTMPVGGKSYKHTENPQAALEYGGPYMVFDTTGTTGTAYSNYFYGADANASQLIMEIGRLAGSPTVTVHQESTNGAGTITQHGGQSVTAAGWTKLYFNQTTTNMQRFRFEGVGVYAVRNILVPSQTSDMYFWSTTSIPTEAARHTWVDATAHCLGIQIKRGARPNPPVDQLEIGTCEMKFKNGYYVDRMRYGCRVRVSAKVGTTWTPIYTGNVDGITILDAIGDRPAETTILAVDKVAHVSRNNASKIRAGTVTQRIISVLHGNISGNKVGLRVQNSGSTGFIENAALIAEGDRPMLDHLLTLRNNDMGLLWCDKEGFLQYVSGQQGAIIPEPNGPRPVLKFVGANPQPGEKSMLVGGYDNNRRNDFGINEILVERIGVDASNKGTSVVTRWLNRPGRTFNGASKGDITVIDLYSGAAQTVAKAYFSMMKDSTGVDYFHWNATKDVASAATMDIYDTVEVTTVQYYYDARQVYRVLSLEHNIKPGSWVTKVSLRPKETTDKTSVPVTQA